MLVKLTIRRATAVTAVVALTAAVGCAGGEARGTRAALARWAATLDYRVGSAGDPDLSLTGFRHLAVADDGTVFTLHPQEQVVRVFAPDGKLLRTIGGKGEGPGEFRNAIQLGLVGDSLWVLDAADYRFSFFSPEGERLSGFRVPVAAPRSPTDRPARATGLLPDGTILGAHPAWSRLVADGTLSADTIFRMDRDGEVRDTLLVKPVEVWRVADPENPQGLSGYQPQPYSDLELAELAPDGSGVVRVRRDAPPSPETARFRVVKLDLRGDTLFSRAFAYEPYPVDRRAADSLAAEVGLRMSRVPFPGAPTAARATGWARRSLRVPDYAPPVRELLLGRDGTIWLRREATREATDEWIVLSPTGDPLATVQLPARLIALAADAQDVWGAASDAMDVPHLVHYRVGPVPPAAEEAGR